jgi:acetyl-CoA carboxylase biotin carboxyl carrier protein
MTLDEIRELIALVNETGIAELELQRGDNRLRVRRSFGSETQTYAPVTMQSGVSQTSAPQPVAGAGSVPAAQHFTPAPTPPPDPKIQYVKSPIVGTFYESPSPDASPFVRIGETVQPGKVLCIIESMKLMNEIEAEFAGVVESRLVTSGSPVEYGEALFGIS